MPTKNRNILFVGVIILLVEHAKLEINNKKIETFTYAISTTRSFS